MVRNYAHTFSFLSSSFFQWCFYVALLVSFPKMHDLTVYLCFGAAFVFFLSQYFHFSFCY